MTFAAATAAGVTLAGGSAQAKFKVLHSFCQNQHRFCGDGSNPQGGLVMDQAGNFYGTTATGGRGLGTAFELERKSGGGFNFKTIYRFCKSGLCGQNPSSNLIIDSSGNLYGVAKNLVFELSPGGRDGLWTETILYRFCSQQNCTDGNDPGGGLAYAGVSSGAPYDGKAPLFGVTATGGAHNSGTVFEVTNNGGIWSEGVLYSFCSEGGENCTDGNSPQASVVIDSSGSIYGTTKLGGGNDPVLDGAGVIFELSPAGNGSWAQTTLYRFCSRRNCADGARPWGALTLDSTGIIYGTTLFGGGHCAALSDGCGVVFKLLPNGADSEETVLYRFCRREDCKDGAAPKSSVVLTQSGDLLGTTSLGGGNDVGEFTKGGGTLFQLSGASFEVLHKFCSSVDCDDGAAPSANPILGLTGEVHGAAELAGRFGNSSIGGTTFLLVR